MMTSGNFV